MPKPEIKICMGSSCYSRGNENNLFFLRNYMEENNLNDECNLSVSGTVCMNKCCDGPNIFIDKKRYTIRDTYALLAILKKLF